MKMKGIKPIEEKFMENNYLFAMGFREGFIFGRTIRRRICKYKPWYLIDANGDAIDIAPGYATQGNLRFRDPRSSQNDILYLDDENDQGLPWFMHGAIGIKPPQVYMYLRIPEAKDIPGRFPNIDPVVPSAGDRTGYISEIESPYENPTDYMEIIIPPKIHIAAEYYNHDSDQWNHRPAFNLTFCVYWFQAFDPVKYPELVSAIARRKVPSDFFTAGVGRQPLDFDSGLEREWGVTTITLDEAAALTGQIRGGRF